MPSCAICGKGIGYSDDWQPFMSGIRHKDCQPVKKLSEGKLEIIYRYTNKPYGIRDSSGFLLFFPNITRYPGQNDRYVQEIEQQAKLADYLLKALKEEGK
jgi:hypothetical protein